MRTGESGQAAVEVVALLPWVALLLALAWQLVLAGDAASAVAAAARAAARAAAVGADPGAAARAHLPRRLERGLEVRRDGAAVRVRVAVPAVVPKLRLGHVSAHASFAPQGEAP
jgi:pilus assembly protein CpaE